MARTLAFPYKRGEFINTSPANIQFDEELNGRAFLYTEADFLDLLTDLREGRKIETPIWCESVNTVEGNGLKLVAGFRRLLAGLAYLKENPEYLIKVLVVEPKDSEDALIMNLRENVGHLGISLIDKGHAAIRLRQEPTKDGGRTLAQIGQILGIDGSTVKMAMRLVENLPSTVQRMIHNGVVTVDGALTVLKADPEKREGLINEFLLGMAGTVPVTVVPAYTEAVAEAEKEQSGERTLRAATRAAGGKVPLRIPEVKKYLQMAIDEDGPGSNKGEVKLKAKFLLFLGGEITQRTMDTHFNNLCKMKGE